MAGFTLGVCVCVCVEGGGVILGRVAFGQRKFTLGVAPPDEVWR